MQITKNWNEVTFYQYLEIEKAFSTDLSSFEFNLEIISILLNTTPDDPILYELDFDEFDLNSIMWVHSPIEPKQFINSEWKLKPLNRITLGEYIDIDAFWDTPEVVISILLRRFKHDEWGNEIMEPYIFDPHDRSEWFLDFPAREMTGILQEYTKWKEHFLEQYSELFNDKIEDSEDEVELNGRDKIMAKKEEAIEAARNKWSWENLVWNLSGKNITKFEDVFNTPIILVFNTLSMNKVFGD